MRGQKSQPLTSSTVRTSLCFMLTLRHYASTFPAFNPHGNPRGRYNNTYFTDEVTGP